MKKFRVPYSAKCIKEYKSQMYPDVDFGQLGKVYLIDKIIPNGHYYVLRDLGEPNYLVNMDRFEPMHWDDE
jgi:hypothetical protein